MEENTRQKPRGRRIHGVLAWGGFGVAAVTLLILWRCLVVHESGFEGHARPPWVLFAYSGLLLANVAASLLGVRSFFGVRSWRDAVVIIPGALLGIGFNVFSAFICVLGVMRSIRGGMWTESGIRGQP